MITKVTRLEFYQYGYAEIAMNIGLISPSEYFRYVHYQMYETLRKEGYNKTNAVELIADRTGRSFSTVWRDVHFFLQ